MPPIQPPVLKPVYQYDGTTDPAALRPQLVNPSGLRRWRAALANAWFGRASIVCIGDSLIYGQGGDGTNNAPGDNVVNGQRCMVGQLRKLFAATYGDPGEGAWLPDDSRVTKAGAPGVSLGLGSWIRHNLTLDSPGVKQLSFVIPAGVTRFAIVQANGAGQAANGCRYSINGGAQVNVPQNLNGVPFVSADIVVNAGDAIVIDSPAGFSSTIVGLLMKTALTTGVEVHRIGVGGYCVADVLGGIPSGKGANTPATLQATAAAQLADLQAVSRVFPPSVVLLNFRVNDQGNQLGAGGASGVFIDLYRKWYQQIIDQYVADGHCVLLIGSPSSPNAWSLDFTNPLVKSEQDYADACKSLALNNDHVAYLDLRELWGNNPDAQVAAQAAGLEYAGSVHCTPAGYGDWARLVHWALTRPNILGN